MKRSLSYKIALGGTLASMCLMCQFITGVFPVFYIIMPMICSLLVTVMATETNTRWALLMFLAVSILSLFITPNKDAALIFIMFFGHYPLIRPAFLKLKPRILSFALKLIFFNICIICYFIITVFVLGAKELIDEMGEFGKYGGVILLGTANMMFISYDYLMDIAEDIYVKKFRSKIANRH